MEENIFKFKTKVPKEGTLESYINKPVLDRILSIEESTNAYMFNEIPKQKIIGIISDVVELEDCYELTLTIWVDKIQFKKEFIVTNNKKELMTISITW